MRSFKWQALFAAAMFAVPSLAPSLAMAQSANDVKPELKLDQNLNLNLNENQTENQIEIQSDDQNDPFYAVPDGQPRPKRTQTIRVQPRVDVKAVQRTDRKNMVYTTKTLAFGRLTDSMGLSISNVPPAMAAQLRLQPGAGVVVEQIAPDSAIESAGIEQYDIIEKVDGKTIHQGQDLTNALRNSKSDSISLDIVRQAKRRSISVDRNQLRQSKAFSFTRGERSGGPAGGAMGFEFKNKIQADGKDDFDGDRNKGDRDRDQADRERQKADRERDKADRDRQRELDRAQRDRDRQGAKRDAENSQRDQLNQMREQIKSTLDRERGELDKAREQLNRATQEMNARLNELRVKLDTEVRQKMEQELRKGQDQIRQKMELLDQQTRDLGVDEPKDHDEHEEKK